MIDIVCHRTEFGKNLDESIKLWFRNRNEVTNNMSEEEMIERIKCECFTGDSGKDHERADGILCDILRLLGLEELADTYESVSKWY